MQIDPKTIKKHFQKSIDKYPDNALVQKLMAQKLAQLVPSECGEILEIGSGAGLLTKELSEHKFSSYTANDLVPKSELYVKKFIPCAKFYTGDFRRQKFGKTFDLIVSNAVFQWCENLDKTYQWCYNNLNKTGLLVFSSFTPENFKEFRELSGLSLDYKSVDEIKSALKPYFEIVSIKEFEHKLTFDNPLQILAHMKNTGVNSLSDKKWGIKEVKDFCDKYKERYMDCELTYAPVLVVAKKLG